MARLLPLCALMCALTGCLFLEQPSVDPVDPTPDLVDTPDQRPDMPVVDPPDPPDVTPDLPVDPPTDMSPDLPTPCPPCEGGQVCDPAAPELGCSCPPGTQDSDGDGFCAPSCAEAPCSPQQTCDDTSGIPVCECMDGLQDNDGDGVCSPTCDTAGLGCTENRPCDDTSGTAVCGCEPGFQDNDGDSICEPACAPGVCFLPERCDDSIGRTRCVWAECPIGQQDYDEDGVCAPSCDTKACGVDQKCDDSTGVALCEKRCGNPRLQDNDGNGTCEASCRDADATDCEFWQTCDDATGEAVCVPAPNGCPSARQMFDAMGIEYRGQAIDITIYQNGNIDRPMPVTCDYTSNTPTSYLILPEPNVFENRLLNKRVTFHKLWLDPFNMVAKIDDLKHADVDDLPDATPSPVMGDPPPLYGIVGGCEGDAPAKGTVHLPRNVVVDDTWELRGTCAMGMASDTGFAVGLRPNQKIELTASGRCGTLMPKQRAATFGLTDCNGAMRLPTDPNNPRRFELKLRYERP